ncbi:MAG TPA: hypothetical protein VFZ34_07905 [Blastocatellia bacterium]|nr:hypothetical protein [Blastocatellia bacterium]
MKQAVQTWFSVLLTATLIINSLALSTLAQQRPRRMSDLEPTTLAVGTRRLPAHFVLVLRMKSRLTSAQSQPSDRFEAFLNEPITDEAGNMVLPANLLVVGHVAAVTPAQMGRRSGIIEITFDRLVMPDGRELPLNGVLTSPDAAERRRLKIDEEGVIEGGGQLKRNTVFIGGGAAAGAAIGAIAGGALLGAGVGAAAGVVAVLLAKGKEAVVEPGMVIGMELIEPLDLTQRGIIPPPRPTTPTTPTTSPNTENPSTPAPNGSQQPTPLPTPPPEPQPVKVTFVQAERISGGSILVVATAETGTGGWRLKTKHQVNRDTLEIWVKGTPPEGRASKILSHPTTTLTVADPNRVIRNVIVHGSGPDRSIAIPPQIRR